MIDMTGLYAHHDKVVKFINRKCNNCHDAEDFVQDAYVRSANHLDKIDPSSAYAWMCTVVVNLWKDSLESKRPLNNLGIVKTDEDGLIMEDRWYHGKNLIEPFIVINEMEFQFDDKILEVLSTCSPLEKEIFELRYLHGLKYPDIRKQLKIKAWQVKSSLHVIKNKMKDQITR